MKIDYNHKSKSIVSEKRNGYSNFNWFFIIISIDKKIEAIYLFYNLFKLFSNS